MLLRRKRSGVEASASSASLSAASAGAGSLGSGSAAHIRSMRDVRSLTLTQNTPNSAREDALDGSTARNSGAQSGFHVAMTAKGAGAGDFLAQFVCPITGLELNGLHKYAHSASFSLRFYNTL